MARLFVSFVHEDENLASAVKDLLQTELNLGGEVFLSSDTAQIYAGDLWLQKIKEALSAAEIVILMLSQRSVARPWVNFEAGARRQVPPLSFSRRNAATGRARRRISEPARGANKGDMGPGARPMLVIS